jgi:hypothetical protein
LLIRFSDRISPTGVTLRVTMLAQYEWQDANRKRGREDEYEDVAAGGTLGFTEHRSVS